MATARDTITRAMRLVNIVADGEAPDAAEAADGLVALNDMLHGWAKQGVDLGHIDLALTDDHKTHASWLEGIRYNLAVRLAAEYTVPVAPQIAAMADKAFSAFQMHALEFADDLHVDHALDPRYFNVRRSGAYDIDKG